jgi:hypothetical protein
MNVTPTAGVGRSDCAGYLAVLPAPFRKCLPESVKCPAVTLGVDSEQRSSASVWEC